MATPQPIPEILIRPLREGDLDEAHRIVALAFGTFLGLPDPSRFMSDSRHVHTRWKADPSAALAAEHEGKLIGSNFAANWGSFGFFGPLTILPDYWNRGVAQKLLGPTMEIFKSRWKNRHLGLYTFANSAKHMALYQKYGFWPRDLVATPTRPLDAPPAAAPADTSLFSETKSQDRAQRLSDCREVTAAVFDGLDARREILAVADQNLGDTVLVWDSAKLAAFGVCHIGVSSEAGSGVCYVKFAAVRPDARAGQNFSRLIDACEALGAARGAKKLLTGVNLSRREAFQELFRRGYRTEYQGVAMETGDASSGYNRAGVYILDDWR